MNISKQLRSKKIIKGILDSEKYVNILNKISEGQSSGECDIENDHINADDVLCRLLEELGLYNVTKAFHKIIKWYA